MKSPLKNLLKLKRWEVGMKQYELASRLGCSASYLSMVENGRVEPTEEFKEKTATIFHLDVKVLFPEKPPNSSGMLSSFFPLPDKIAN